jgi:hypothetical protein
MPMVTGQPSIFPRRSEADDLPSAHAGHPWALGVVSLFFIVLQSVCTVVMALSGVRILIGLGALAAVVAGAQAPATGFHRDSIRIPMMVLAVLGSFMNLYMVWRVRSLRSRQSSQWRQQPISRRRLWREHAQLALSLVTLLLVLAEFLAHHYIFRLVG